MGSNCVTESIIPMDWTFDEGIHASCDAFSIAIPDGYRILDNHDHPRSGWFALRV